jgi:hypothetical protein
MVNSQHRSSTSVERWQEIHRTGSWATSLPPPSLQPKCSENMLPMVPIAALVAVAIPLLAQGAAVAQPGNLVYPQPGVVCDSVGRVCYDSYGASIGITQINYGQRAADRLQQNLYQAKNRDFRLSTGQACSVSQRLCWDDGWGQRNIAHGLTHQLFGTSNGVVQPGRPQVARDSGLCSLSRGGQRVYDGPCQLKQVMQGNENRYVVQLQSGNRYVFVRQGGNYVITDGFGGSWPVTFVDHGPTGVFRFGDYKLVATQSSGGRQAPSQNEAVGNALGTMLNSLFSR